MEDLTPELLLMAYASGVFPMADARNGDDIRWFDPEKRGVIPLASMHVPSSLRKIIRKRDYMVTFDRDFDAVINACADLRQDTWINDNIIAAYTGLYDMGNAHSVEVRDMSGNITGGLYGVSIGAAFFGESMFSLRPNASKIALVYLAARLWRRGYTLLDTQYVNSHLKQFGCIEMPRAEYKKKLAQAIESGVTFGDQSGAASVSTGSGSGVAAGLSGAASVSMNSSAGFASGAFASGLDDVVEVSSPPCLLSDAGFSSDASLAASVTVDSGVFSDENFSAFADTELFLQSITQTS